MKGRQAIVLPIIILIFSISYTASADLIKVTDSPGYTIPEYGVMRPDAEITFTEEGIIDKMYLNFNIRTAAPQQLKIQLWDSNKDPFDTAVVWNAIYAVGNLNNDTFDVSSWAVGRSLAQKWYLYIFDFSNSGGASTLNNWSITAEYNPTNPVPEPATMILFGTGLAGLAAVSRRRKSSN